MLFQWLKAGYMENNFTYPTRKGVPQVGIVSPVLANMTLDGLEKIVLQSAPYRSRVNFVRYADDFIITGKSRTILEKYVIPVVKQFLEERGLELSEDKTRITYIKKGFTFLGQTFRKHGRILHITPAEEGIRAVIRKVGIIIRKNTRRPLAAMIKELNQVLKGWAYYHRYIVASEAFSRVDNYVFDQLWRMLLKRHPKRSKKWLVKKYWRSSGNNKRVFTVTGKVKGKSKQYQVFRDSAIWIKRHRKVITKANPYMTEYRKYFWIRRHYKEATQLKELSARRMIKLAAAS